THDSPESVLGVAEMMDHEWRKEERDRGARDERRPVREDIDNGFHGQTLLIEGRMKESISAAWPSGSPAGARFHASRGKSRADSPYDISRRRPRSREARSRREF